MNGFRQVLDEYLARQRGFDAVERELDSSLAQQPQLAAAHGAYVEALYRGGRVGGEDYLVLVQRIRKFQESQSQGSAGLPGLDSASGEDRTQLRRLDQPPAAAPQNSESDKTRFRAIPQPTPVTPPTPTPATPLGTPAGRSAAGYEPLPGEVIIKGRFVLEDEIGRSDMGAVIKARDLRKEEAQDRKPHVALKVLSPALMQEPQALDAWQREARAAQHLAHPNILTVHNFHRDDSIAFIVMELLEGDRLERVIQRAVGGGLATKDALRISRDICSAMAYAHGQGVLHTDFKPADVYVTREGVVKILDFAFARAKRARSAAPPAAAGAGSPGAAPNPYASCEILKGLEPDARDDIYAVACVTYELLTGKLPYGRRTALEAREANMAPEPVPGLRRAQWRALQKGLSFDREQRPASALEFLSALHPAKRPLTLYIGTGLAAALALFIASLVISGQVARYREQTRIAALATASAAQIEPLLPTLDAMQAEQRNAIFAHEEARAGLMRYFESAISAATDSTRGPADFVRAEALAEEVRGFFPDSVAAKELVDRVASLKSASVPAPVAAEESPRDSAAVPSAQVASEGQAAPLAQGDLSAQGTSSERATPVAQTVPQAEGASSAQGVASAQATSPAQAAPRPRPAVTTRPGACLAEMVREGRSKQGVCFDSLEGGHGPELVVVPAPGGKKKLAIGRTQVTNGDYALYCARSEHCKAPPGLSTYPVTFLSLEDAEGYLEWLSQATGVKYRLPTDMEWKYSADARDMKRAGAFADCRVELDPKLAKNAILHATLSGAPNNWGLYNVSGSAQEWVRTESTVGIRGGAFAEHGSRCRAAPQSGAPDSMIGFRVLREVD